VITNTPKISTRIIPAITSRLPVTKSHSTGDSTSSRQEIPLDGYESSPSRSTLAISHPSARSS
jgi:hypothetical protein